MRREKDTRANIVESGNDKRSSYDGFDELGSRDYGFAALEDACRDSRGISKASM